MCGDKMGACDADAPFSGMSTRALPEVHIDVLALVTARATLAYLATGRNGQRGANFACCCRDAFRAS